MEGYVFDIQRYSIHDGAGIRTVVFLKGCPLRCKWCANPESWSLHPELFYIKSRCIGCKTCVGTCPNQEVISEGENIHVIREKCTEDVSWAGNCPTGALCVKGKRMETGEVFEEICKDLVFYRQSGGGVTFSGGEPLLQPEFVTEILRFCKEKGISTAVETTGYVSWKALEMALPYTDLFLYDVKTMDTEVHKKWTGLGNERILEHLKQLSGREADIMVRTPVIPNVNDRKEDIQAIMDYLKECQISKYNILPFHQYGSGKYESIGIPYEMADVKVPDEAYVQEMKNMIKEAGFSDQF